MMPLLLRPQNDEILSSWLIRNSIANGSDPMGFVSGIWFDRRPWTIDYDRTAPDEMISTLARTTGVSVDRLRKMTLRPTVTYLIGNPNPEPKTAWPWVIPIGSRNRMRMNGLHFCPECLTEKNAYFKKAWRLSWNTACPKHRILLALHCPRCHQVFSPHLVDYRSPYIHICTRCGFDLRKAPSSNADPVAVELQDAMSDALKSRTFDSDRIGTELGEDSVVELFRFVRDLTTFFRNLRRRPKMYEVMTEDLGFEPDGLVFERAMGTSIDSASAEERHLFFRISALTLRKRRQEVVEFFSEHGVTRNALDDLCRSDSATMRSIRMKLEERSRKRTTRKCVHSIGPRSKEEVEAAMEKIRRYL